MLDLHAISGTPGAAVVLGAAFPTIAVNDGASNAGVPISDKAVLVLHGANSVTANTIGNYKLSSQDLPDPINGVQFLTGAASLLNQVIGYCKVPYKTGLRQVQLGTNTAVGACLGWFLDAYDGGNVTAGQYINAAPVVTPATTFGGALTTLVWGEQAYAPATPIPMGKYAILGAWVSAITNAAIIRFAHSDFQGFRPGFPVHNYETISTATWDKAWKDSLILGANGYQFVHLSEKLGIPCCPIFSVTNAGTGLNMQICDVQADTPVVILNLQKVG